MNLPSGHIPRRRPLIPSAPYRLGNGLRHSRKLRYITYSFISVRHRFPPLLSIQKESSSQSLMNILTPRDPSLNYSDPLSVNDRLAVRIITFAPCLCGKRERRRKEIRRAGGK